MKSIRSLIKGVIGLGLLATVFGCELQGLSDEQIANGLKEALRHGVDTAVVNLNREGGFMEDQLVKILLPEEAQPVYNVLSQVPILDGLVDQTILAINRSAEDAVLEATPIFFNAITDITIVDAVGMLNGEDTAATSYLRSATYQDLFDAFNPKIGNSLNKEFLPGISAESSYRSLINTYNTASLGGLLFDRIQENSLTNHTTNKALKGMFLKIGEEETKIRTDVEHRVTDILEQVFSELDE